MNFPRHASVPISRFVVSAADSQPRPTAEVKLASANSPRSGAAQDELRRSNKPDLCRCRAALDPAPAISKRISSSYSLRLRNLDRKSSVVRAIREIAKPDAHIMINRPRNRDRNADSEDGMSHGQRIEVPIPKKKQAGDASPEQRQRRQDGIRQMRQREQARRCNHGSCFARL